MKKFIGHKKSKISDCRYFQIAGITIRVASDLPLTASTFHKKFKLFEIEIPGDDIVTIQHHFDDLPLKKRDFGDRVYSSAPWDIYWKGNYWVYACNFSILGYTHIYQLSIMNHDHTMVRIYNKKRRIFRKGNLQSLTLFPTDQILMARVLADRAGCYLHAGGVILDGSGFLFVGHSESGKSTMVTMLKHTAEILCDDRVILRRWPEGIKIHGTWSHGDVPDISPKSAPLRGVFFLVKASENRIVPIQDRREAIKKILPFLIKPFVTAGWWDQILTLAAHIVREVPFYSLYFNKNGNVVDLIRHL